jgi:ABC-2 type transport system ATP-binding protein
MKVLEIKGLSKSYGKIKALDQLNLTLESGNIYGLLGPNGSGKTTTLGILLNVLKADTGSFTWFEGKYGSEERKHIGAILEKPNFYSYLNAMSNLKIVQQIKQSFDDDIHELLEMVNLYDRRKSAFKTYSLGMKQRLAIASAMIGNPEVMIFDEPTNGLDPQGIAEVRNIIKKIAKTGKTIFMASHILDEVEKICSHVAILKQGQLLAEGPVGAILEADKLIEVAVKEGQEEDMLSELKNIAAIHNIERSEDCYILSVDENFESAALNRILFDHDIVVSHLKERKKTLEEEFLTITQ